jgi:hypothetical protein
MENELVIIFGVNMLISGVTYFITGFISVGILNNNGYKVKLYNTQPLKVLRNLKELVKSKIDLKLLYYILLFSIIYIYLVMAPLFILVALIILKSIVQN